MIKTNRLLIKPLTHQQLIKYARCDQSLEQELKLNPSNRTISDELKEALEQTIIPNVADRTKNYLYSTLWTAICVNENKMVADLCLIGEPNEMGEVEIGYGTYPEFAGKGYMTELVGGLIGWLKTQPPVKAVVASTLKTNVASYRVLQKNQFIQVGETDSSLLWKLSLL